MILIQAQLEFSFPPGRLCGCAARRERSEEVGRPRSARLPAEDDVRPAQEPPRVHERSHQEEGEDARTGKRFLERFLEFQRKG